MLQMLQTKFKTKWRCAGGKRFANARARESLDFSICVKRVQKPLYQKIEIHPSSYPESQTVTLEPFVLCKVPSEFRSTFRCVHHMRTSSRHPSLMLSANIIKNALAHLGGVLLGARITDRSSASWDEKDSLIL